MGFEVVGRLSAESKLTLLGVVVIDTTMLVFKRLSAKPKKVPPSSNSVLSRFQEDSAWALS